MTEDLSSEASIHLPCASAMSTLLLQKNLRNEATKDESKYISPVLTSAQNMRLLEKKKEEDMNAKEKRKLEREEKKIKKLYLENAKINLCKYSRYM